MTSLSLTPFQSNLTWNERWYLDYYRSRAAVRLGNYYISPFWNGLVLQICDQHPVVCHAAIAFGAYYHHLEKSRHGEIADLESLPALYHSTKAITCLRESLARDSAALTGSTNYIQKELVIVTCALFANLAFLQGDLPAFRSHLTSGYNLLKQWEIEKRSLSGFLLTQLFVRMRGHSAFCSNPKLLQILPDDADYFHVEYSMLPRNAVPSSNVSETLFTPIDQLDRIWNLTSVLNGVVIHGTYSDFEVGPACSLNDHAIEISTNIQLVLRASHNQPPGNNDSLKLVALWAEVIGIKVAVAQIPGSDEIAYDDHLEQFQRAAKMALDLSDPGTNVERLSPMFHEVSVVPALLWIGLKCRNWLVRRDVLYILRNLAGDHFWVCATTTALSRLILLESNGVKRGEFIPKASRFDRVNVRIDRAASKVELRHCTLRTPTKGNGDDHLEVMEGIATYPYEDNGM
ncbi:unnamed protein product [Penicillium olsonii]|nr:unnamed protein product [Penicillium olsonii]